MVSIAPSSLSSTAIEISFSLLGANIDVGSLHLKLKREIERSGFDASPLSSTTDGNRPLLDGLFESFVKEPCFMSAQLKEGNGQGGIQQLSSIIRQSSHDIIQVYAKRGSTCACFRVKSEGDRKTLSTHFGLYRQPKWGSSSDETLLDCVAHHLWSIYQTCYRHPDLFTKYSFRMCPEVTPTRFRDTFFRRVIAEGHKQLTGKPRGEASNVEDEVEEVIFDVSQLPVVCILLMDFRLTRFLTTEVTPTSS
eukprot:GHVN01056194.1.p1 GENE.GHVN01056194.1~~GHVN01056194.1.p1  ORF type:complete len:250 (+),score=30.15 GHVN01056194.1:200-949(+)